ncbi:MAG: hypothetical protein WDW36_004613 [Sanguina aurantia]
MARKKPFEIIFERLIANSGIVTTLLLIVGYCGIALLPALERPIHFDEKALVAGAAAPSSRMQPPSVLQDGLRFASAVGQQYGQPGSADLVADHMEKQLGMVSHRSGSTHPDGGGGDFGAGAALVMGVASTLMAHLSTVHWLAKDIVWLVPDSSCGGSLNATMQWVAAYGLGQHLSRRSDAHVSDFSGRAGLMQQAIVLESASAGYNRVEVLLESFNGQLPKLDMYQLLRYFSAWQHGRLVLTGDRPLPAWLLAWLQGGAVQVYLQKVYTVYQLIWRQALGGPVGPHAAFKSVMVDAVTLRLELQDGQQPVYQDLQTAIPHLVDTLELVIRSLNNLVERVHHSFSLYLQTDIAHFVPVEVYIILPVALVAALLLQHHKQLSAATAALELCMAAIILAAMSCVNWALAYSVAALATPCLLLRYMRSSSEQTLMVKNHQR